MQEHMMLLNTDPIKLIKKIAARLAVLGSTVLLFAACSGKSESESAQAHANPVAQSFPVFKLAAHNTILNSDYPATLQGQQNIEIRPKVDGFIEKILIDEGSMVKKGQLLFLLSAPQYAQEVVNSTAAISSAEADVSAAELQVNKTKPLVDKGIISHYELESAQFTLRSRKAALRQAKASLFNANTNLGYTRIISPVEGVVGSIPYKLGSLITATTAQPLTTVSNIGKVYAYFSWNEKQLLEFSRTANGNTIAEKLANTPAVKLILSDGTPYAQDGRVETLSGLINTETGSASFRASFPNPKGLIRSGGSATLRIPQAVNQALLIPQKCSYELQGKHFVYVVDNSGKVKSKEIQILDRQAQQFFVVTSGISAGETIVLDGASSLIDGTVIKPQIQNSETIYKGI